MRRLLTPAAIPAALGGTFVWLAVWMWFLHREPGETVFYDHVWPWAFAAAGVMSMALAFHRSRHLTAWAGALLVGACLSRAYAIAMHLWNDNDVSDSEAVIRATAWVGFGFALSVIWAHVLMPRDADG